MMHDFDILIGIRQASDGGYFLMVNEEGEEYTQTFVNNNQLASELRHWANAIDNKKGIIEWIAEAEEVRNALKTQ